MVNKNLEKIIIGIHLFIIDKFFLFLILLYVLLRGFNIISLLSIPQIYRYYLPDLLAIPVLIVLTRFLLFILTSYDFYKVLQPLTFGFIAFISLFVALIFELILPYVSYSYIADKIDVLMYIFGGTFYYFTLNKKPQDLTILGKLQLYEKV